LKRLSAEALVPMEASAMPSAFSTESTPPIVIPAPSVAPAPVVAAIVESVEPWPGSDENAVIEIIRAVVAVGCAGVWVITIVAVRAIRRRSNVYRSRNSKPELNRHLSMSTWGKRADEYEDS
jgi:hypothetical protein